MIVISRRITMNSLQKIFKLALCVLAFLALAVGSSPAQTTRTLTVGTASGTVGGADVTVPITISDATGVGGVAFTLTYNPAFFTFKGLEQATPGWTINDGSAYTAGQNPYTASPAAAPATLFYQFNDVGAPSAPVGRILFAGASAEPLSGTALFRAKFGIKAGINGTTYPIGIQRSIIRNPAAGYATDTMLPVLIGTGEKTGGKYTTSNFPVIPATLVAGGITVSAPTLSLGGKVTYGTGGANATGCTVTLTRETASGYVFVSQTTVGSDGRYNFTGRDAGNYKIAIASLDPNYNNFESGVITLSANRTDADAALTLKPQPVRVTGTVTSGNIPGLLAQVIDPAGKVMGTYSIASDGTFTSPLLPALGSGQAYRWNLLYGSLSTGPFDNAGTTTFNTAQLKSISGTISGLPAGGGAVTASSVKGKITKTLQVTRTGDNTDYSIENLVAADDYIVSAVATGLPLTYYNGKTDVNEATAVNIATNNATGINFNFVPPAKSIKGWIRESGAGVNAITVYGFEVNTFALISTQTDAQGNYSLSVPVGSYEIFVIKGNGKIFYFANMDGTPTQNQANAVLRVVTANITELPNSNINITEADKILTGKVTLRTATGDPAANVLITVTDAKTRAQGLTGVDGRYQVGGLEAKTYTVTMKPLVGNYPVQTASVAISATGVNERNFIIDTGSVLSGRVTDQGTAATVAGAMLYLKDQATGALVGGRIYFSAANGDYSIRDIPSGEYTLEVTHPDYRGFMVNLVIGSDMTHNVALEKGAHFKGTVTEAGSNPVKNLPGATIIVTRTGETPVYTVTNSAGFYSVYGLDSSKTDYIIIAQARGYERQAKTSQKPETAGTTANFALARPVTYYTLSGTVKTGDQTGIEGAIVLVSSPSKNFFATTTTAPTTGAYSVANLIASTDYRIVVIAPGLPTQELSNQTIDADKTQNFTFPLGRDIGGNITGDQAIPAATKIYVFLYKNNVYQGFQEAATGAFLFKALEAASDYKILAVATGYAPRWFNGKAGIDAADNINITSASKLDVNIQLIKQ